MFTLTFDTDNAAFEESREAEFAQIFAQVLFAVRAGKTSAKVKDTNGNTVGSFSLEEA